MFRRCFTTTARLFRRPNGKPPTQEPNIPPPPHNDPKPNNNPKDEDAKRPNIFEHFRETANPRSKGFMFAFANPKIPAEERSKSLLFATIATFTAWATEPWMMPLGQEQWFPTREEYLVDLIAYTIVNAPKKPDEAIAQREDS